MQVLDFLILNLVKIKVIALFAAKFPILFLGTKCVFQVVLHMKHPQITEISMGKFAVRQGQIQGI